MAKTVVGEPFVSIATIMRKRVAEILSERIAVIGNLEKVLRTVEDDSRSLEVAKAIKTLRETRGVCERALDALAPGPSTDMEEEYQRAMRGFKKEQPKEKGGEDYAKG